MNIAVIFAGGTGQRMNSKTVPKQFLELYAKPIIIYTLEHFQNHPDIDGIIIACLESWIDYCDQIIEKFGISKVSAIVPGGENSQDSIYHGLEKAEEMYPPESIVLVHDGVRPLIDAEIIRNCISCVKKNGSAVVVSPATETVTIENDSGRIGEIIPREKCQMAKAPQCFYLNELLDAHRQAYNEGKGQFIDSASIMRWSGHSLYTVEGPAENIKITTPSDYYMFRAMLDAKENSQIFGV